MLQDDGVSPPRGSRRDLTVLATPAYFATMIAEGLYLRRRQRQNGGTPGNYTTKDTVASLIMGQASLFVPLIVPKLLRPLTPGRGRGAKLLIGAAVAATAVAVGADGLTRRVARRPAGQA